MPADHRRGLQKTFLGQAVGGRSAEDTGSVDVAFENGSLYLAHKKLTPAICGGQLCIDNHVVSGYYLDGRCSSK